MSDTCGCVGSRCGRWTRRSGRSGSSSTSAAGASATTSGSPSTLLVSSLRFVGLDMLRLVHDALAVLAVDTAIRVVRALRASDQE
eukprot:1937305-Rhodomonas_salina.1